MVISGDKNDNEMHRGDLQRVEVVLYSRGGLPLGGSRRQKTYLEGDRNVKSPTYLISNGREIVQKDSPMVTNRYVTSCDVIGKPGCGVVLNGW
jgi:hypothetical protein